VPRGVASIDPQDSLFFPTDRVSGSLAALPLPHHAHRASSPLLPFPFHPRYRRVPLRRPDHPSWFTSLFTVSLSHLPARLSHTTPAPTPRPTSLFRRCRTPPSSSPPPSRRRRGVTWSFDRGRCLELESRRVRQIRRTFADPGLDPSATLRMEIKAEPLETRERSTAQTGLWLPSRRRLR